jgi:hypothetical protein
MKWLPHVIIVLGAMYFVLSWSTAYQTMRAQIEHDREVASELAALAELAGVKPAARQFLHGAIRDLERPEGERSLLVETFLGQMRAAGAFVFVDVLNSRAFVALTITCVVGAMVYIIYGARQPMVIK